jgi:biopolymer transport protein ExbD
LTQRAPNGAANQGLRVARRHAKTEDTDINITPMLDVVFIMLIFFIVTASFTRETGTVIDKPMADEAVALRNGTILIGVRVNDEIWMSKQQIELREVRQMVERARGENPEGSVVIVADRGARIGTVTQVMDQVRLAGVEGVAISAEQSGR